MSQEEVIQRITELGRQLLPEGASLWLYGSRARGDARPDSDYDLLILLDSDRVTDEANNAAYDLQLFGFDNSLVINLHIYPKNKWTEWTYSPFYKNVEHDKRILI